jgi:LacI family transcriptional regulator
MKQRNLLKLSVRQRIKQEIVRMIGEEMILPGEKIMPQNELAARFNTTPVTIHKALRELVDEGVIERRKGVGTFVSRRRPGEGQKEKKVCLIMHRAGLERPEINPEYWPYMQDLIFDFTTNLCDTYSFSMKFAGKQTDVKRLISELDGYHSVFFHYSNEVPVEIMQAIIRSRVVPVVKIGKMQERLECLLLDNDRFEGMKLATEHLIKLGYRKIGFLGASEWWGDLALAGYRSALSSAGLPAESSTIFRNDENRSAGVQAAESLLAHGKMPDAMVVDSDLRSVGLIARLQEAGVKIPDDFGVVSHDGLQFFTYHPPYLTAVKVPYGEMISRALAVVDSCSGKISSHQVLTFTGSLIPGRTTAPQTAKPPRAKTT